MHISMKSILAALQPGNLILTKTEKPFIIEEIENGKITIQSLSSNKRGAFELQRLQLVIQHFGKIRNALSLERAINSIFKKYRVRRDYTYEPYMYGLAQEFWKRQAR